MRRYDEPVDEFAVSKCVMVNFDAPRVRMGDKALMRSSLDVAVTFATQGAYSLGSAVDDATNDCEAEDVGGYDE